MSLKPSVKDFVLQYFDRLGATITEDDGVYTVTPPADAEAWPVDVPFVFSFTRKDEEAGVHIAIGSTVLKQIIDDCGRRGKVTSRHLAANKVPTAALFEEKLGLTNARVSQFNMVKADTATALCFAHLITYDAPAFGKSEAEIQMDVLDAKTGARDDFLSEQLFDLVTVPYKPDMAMPADKIDWLHERSRYLSNYRSEKRARSLDKELQLRWQVEESRITKYYDQLAQSLKDKENTLVSRIETLESKIGEAKEGSAAREKLQAELETTWARLNELNATVEESLQEIEDGRAGKLAAEKVRHELSVRSELVNVSYLAYDAVTFKVAIEGPGKPGEIYVRYVPVKDDLDLPTCPTCTRTLRQAALDADGHLVCQECADACPRCQQPLCPTCRRNTTVLGSCAACRDKHVLTIANVQEPVAEPVAVAEPEPEPTVRPMVHVHALIEAPVAPAPTPVASGKTVALPTASRPRNTEIAQMTPPNAGQTQTRSAPVNRSLDLPKINRPRRSTSSAPLRVESRMCPHCQASSQDKFTTCQCCGVSVCPDCLAAQMRYCQTCITLGIPRHEPVWIKHVKQSNKNLAKAKKYMVSANQRYGVVHWQGFVGETVVVYDLWQKQVAAVRHGGLLKSLRPRV